MVFTCSRLGVAHISTLWALIFMHAWIVIFILTVLSSCILMKPNNALLH